MSTEIHQSSNFLSRAFKRWAELTFDHPLIAIVSCCIVLIVAALQAQHIGVDMSTEAMLRKNDPARVAYSEFRQQFGREDAIIIAIASPDGLNQTLLQQIDTLQQTLANEVAYVDKITSLINARYTYGDDDELVVEDLLENFPDYRWTNAALNDYVLSQPNYIGRLISRDGQYTAVVIELQTYLQASDGRRLLSEQETQQAVNDIRRVLANTPALQWQLSGQPVLEVTLNDLTAKETQFTSAAGALLVFGLTLLFFRRASGVFFPQLIIVTSILSTIAVMAYFGSPFTLTTNAVLALMLGIAVADAVHILTLFYRFYGELQDKRAAIVSAMSYTAPAVLLTSITTAIGFLSFISGDLASTAELGIYAAIAVTFALLFTITLIPSCIALFKMRQSHQARQENPLLSAILRHCAFLATHYPKTIGYSTIVVLLLCLWGLSLQWFSYDPLKFFPAATQERQDYFAMDQSLDGMTNLEILIDSGSAGGIFEPAFVQQFEDTANWLSDTELAGIKLSSTYSLLDIWRETHQALNGNQAAFYRVAPERELLAQETLMFEMSEADDLFNVTDADKQILRLSVKAFHADGVELEVLLRELETRLAQRFDDTVNITITGASALVAESVPKAIQTMAKSYVVAAFSIIFVMMLLVKSLRMGLVSIVPNILPILLGLNFMVIMDWPLSMSTIMVGAIAMGIVVDDTLHLLYHFKQHFSQSGDARDAVNKTLSSVGPALFITTVVFAACCGTNLLSAVNSVFMFGATMGVVIFSALLADILIAPAMLVWAYDKPSKRKR